MMIAKSMRKKYAHASEVPLSFYADQRTYFLESFRLPRLYLILLHTLLYLERLAAEIVPARSDTMLFSGWFDESGLGLRVIIEVIGKVGSISASEDERTSFGIPACVYRIAPCWLSKP